MGGRSDRWAGGTVHCACGTRPPARSGSGFRHAADPRDVPDRFPSSMPSFRLRRARCGCGSRRRGGPRWRSATCLQDTEPTCRRLTSRIAIQMAAKHQPYRRRYLRTSARTSKRSSHSMNASRARSAPELPVCCHLLMDRRMKATRHVSWRSTWASSPSCRRIRTAPNHGDSRKPGIGAATRSSACSEGSRAFAASSAASTSPTWCSSPSSSSRSSWKHCVSSVSTS